MSDIGLQGTTARGDARRRGKLEAYEIYLRGGLGAHAEIGRPLLRRVPGRAKPPRPSSGWSAPTWPSASDGETFQAFAKRKTMTSWCSIG